MLHLPNPLRLTALAVTCLVATAAPVLASSTAASTTPHEPAPVAGSTVDAGAFPVTIETKYGPVTLEAEPQRVVSVGYNDQDALLALGVIPVGIREWYGGFPHAVWPWARDELGDATPEVLSATEINFEAVAALDPDLIVGVSSGMTSEEFDTLSAIAPTLAQSGDFIDYGMPWDEGFGMIAAAVGRTSLAAEVVASLEQRFADAREAHPEFEGATAAVAFFYSDQPGAYASDDGRSRLLIDLGFTIPAEYDELAGDSFFASFSAEQLHLLDVDVLVWIAGEGTALEAAEQIPGREAMRTYQEGREIFTSNELAGAFSFNSPLSLDHLLDELVPMLAAAVDGDPATSVPES